MAEEKWLVLVCLWLFRLRWEGTGEPRSHGDSWRWGFWLRGEGLQLPSFAQLLTLSLDGGHPFTYSTGHWLVISFADQAQGYLG